MISVLDFWFTGWGLCQIGFQFPINGVWRGEDQYSTCQMQSWWWIVTRLAHFLLISTLVCHLLAHVQNTCMSSFRHVHSQSISTLIFNIIIKLLWQMFGTRLNWKSCWNEHNLLCGKKFLPKINSSWRTTRTMYRNVYV